MDIQEKKLFDRIRKYTSSHLNVSPNTLSTTKDFHIPSREPLSRDTFTHSEYATQPSNIIPNKTILPDNGAKSLFLQHYAPDSEIRIETIREKWPTIVRNLPPLQPPNSANTLPNDATARDRACLLYWIRDALKELDKVALGNQINVKWIQDDLLLIANFLYEKGVCSCE